MSAAPAPVMNEANASAGRPPLALTIDRALGNPHLDAVDARALLGHALGMGVAQMAARPEQALTSEEIERWQGLVDRRGAGEPVAYLVGSREFYSLEFHVTRDVLIPRAESELLVDFALERIVPEAAAEVLDLGTGSGCIAISVAHHRPFTSIVAVDCSESALAIARGNAHRLLETCPSPLKREGRDGGSVGEGNLCFVLSDWFEALVGRRFELILANPPYVAERDAHLMQGDLRFEPRHALAAGVDGLSAIRRIVADAPEFLASGGWLALEHGHDQGEACRDLLATRGFQEVFTRRDLAGIERVTGGRCPGMLTL